MRSGGARLHRILLAVALLAIFGALSQVTRFQSTIRVLVDGDAIKASAHDSVIEGQHQVNKFRKISVITQKSAGAESQLSGFSLRDLEGKRLSERFESSLWLFGRNWLPSLNEARYPSFRTSLGDWYFDRHLSQPLELYSGELPDGFILEVYSTGRGSTEIVLEGAGRLRINLRDGFIDNDFSVCGAGPCIGAVSSDEAPAVNVPRVINFFCEAALVACLFYLLLAIFAPVKASVDGLAESNLSSLSSKDSRWVWGAAILILAHGIAAAVFSQQVLGGIPHIPDSAAYLRQALIMAQGYLSAPLPDLDGVESLLPNAAIVENGRLFFHYNRFWPALLAIGAAFDLPQLVNPLLSALGALFLFLIAKRLFDLSTAFIAVLLYATSPFVILNAADMMDHVATQTLLLGSFACLLYALKDFESGKSRNLLMLSGLLFGAAFTIRQLTSVLWISPLLLLAVWSAPKKAGLLRQFLAGFAPMLFLLAADNYLLTGSPFISPYLKFHGLTFSLNNFALGLNWIDSTLGYFTPGLYFFPAGWIVLGLAMLGAFQLRSRWAFAFSLILPLLVIGYSLVNSHGLHAYGARFLLESSAPIFMLAAAGIMQIARRVPFLVKVPALLVPAAAFLLHCYNLPSNLRDYIGYNGINSGLYQDIKAHRPERSIFIFETNIWYGMDHAARLFDPTFHSALFLKKSNDGAYLKVLAQMPERTAYLVSGNSITELKWWRSEQGRAELSRAASAKVEQKKGAAKSSVTESALAEAVSAGWAVLKWFALFEIFAFLGLMALRLFKVHHHSGSYFIHLFGALLFAWIFWALRFACVVSGTWVSMVAVLAASLLMLYLALPAGSRRSLRQAFLAVPRGAYWGAFLAYLVVRLFQPEIFWGEKPMDFTFLNFFSRLPDIPPEDPWAAGSRMDYYYFGFFQFGALSALSAIDTGYTYNLALATIGAQFFSALCGIGLLLFRSRYAALLTAFAVALASNFEWIVLLLRGRHKIDFDAFWATTRLMTPPNFAEYPLWSHVFADLHPHIMVQPLLVMMLWLGALSVRRIVRPSRASISLQSLSLAWAPLLGFLSALCFVLNSWDAISFAVIFGIAACFGLLIPLWGLIKGRLHDGAAQLKHAALFALLFAAAAQAAVLPQIHESAAAARVGGGFANNNEFNTLGMVIRHLGVFLLPLAVFGATHGIKNFWRVPWYCKPLVLVPALVPFVLALLNVLRGGPHVSLVGIPWGIVAASSLLAALGASLIFSRKRCSAACSAGIFLTAGGLILAATELCFLLDRMNTIFKFYQMLWLLFGLAASFAVFEMARRLKFRYGLLRYFVNGAGLSVVIACGCLSLFGSVLSLYAMLGFRRIDGPRPYLDGTAYMMRKDADEARLLRWMRRRIKGTPRLVEAHGPSYQDFTRVTMHTGLPTLLGWDYHVQQRGLEHVELESRRRAIAEIYASPHAFRAKELLCQFNVDLLFVGERERAIYGESVAVKFQAASSGFSVLKRFGDSRLYSVNCGYQGSNSSGRQ